MKKKLIGALSLMLTFCHPAYADIHTTEVMNIGVVAPTEQEIIDSLNRQDMYCKGLSELAGVVMEMHQQGVPKTTVERMLLKPTTEAEYATAYISDKIVDMVYDVQRFNTLGQQSLMVESTIVITYKICMGLE